MESRTFLSYRAFIGWKQKQKNYWKKHLVKVQRLWKIRGAQHIFFNNTVIVDKTFLRVKKKKGVERADKFHPEFSAQSINPIEEEGLWPKGVLSIVSLVY